jgi:hypothetical protein
MSKFVIQIPHENVTTTEVYNGFLRISRLKNASMSVENILTLRYIR